MSSWSGVQQWESVSAPCADGGTWQEVGQGFLLLRWIGRRHKLFYNTQEARLLCRAVMMFQVLLSNQTMTQENKSWEIKLHNSACSKRILCLSARSTWIFTTLQKYSKWLSYCWKWVLVWCIKCIKNCVKCPLSSECSSWYIRILALLITPNNECDLVISRFVCPPWPAAPLWIPLVHRCIGSM